VYGEYILLAITEARPIDIKCHDCGLGQTAVNVPDLPTLAHFSEVAAHRSP